MLGALIRSIVGGKVAARAQAAFANACSLYAARDLAGARAVCDEALREAPASARFHYLRGLIDCAAGDAQGGAALLARAVELGNGGPLYLAALADARLLEQREDEAFALYCRAFVDLAASFEKAGEGASLMRAHPAWTARLRLMVLPAPPSGVPATAWCPESLADTRATHLLNWGLLFLRRRQFAAAMHALREALKADPGMGYGQAALALLYTLDQRWADALAAARAARELGTEIWPGTIDPCIVAAQLELGESVDVLDAAYDWEALRCAAGDAHLALLPSLQGMSVEPYPAGALVYFVACDTTYLIEHAVALLHSIRSHCEQGAAFHVHLFDPADAAWAAIDRLRAALTPLPVTITWEAVAFDDYSGKARYCACARFVRLYQIVAATPNRVIMLDADSLVRADLGPALAGAGDIGLVRAEHEPPWHRYLAGFSTFRGSAAAAAFLRELSAFIAFNLVRRTGGSYLDQMALYVCARRATAQGARIDELPIAKFCDTLFSEDALVWSVTQDKSADTPFARYKTGVLAAAREGAAAPPD